MKAMGFFGDKHVKQEGLIGLRPAVMGFSGLMLVFSAMIQGEYAGPPLADDAPFAFRRLQFAEVPARWLFHRYLDVELVARVGEAPSPEDAASEGLRAFRELEAPQGF